MKVNPLKEKAVKTNPEKPGTKIADPAGEKADRMTEKQLQQATLDSFTQIDRHVFTVDYQNNYALSACLKKNISNVGGLIWFVQRTLRRLQPLYPLKGRGGCTTFNVYNQDGDHILARNFDYKDAPCIVVWTHPQKGYRSVGIGTGSFLLYGYKHQYPAKLKNHHRVLAAPYTTMDGINEKGLAIAVLEIKAKSTHQKTGKKPIITPVIIRTVLDTCATVEEAVKVFESHDMHDSFYVNYHYQIADASGSSVFLEYINNELRVLRPGECEYYPGKWQYGLNFFIQPEGDNSKGFGYTRQKYVTEALTACGGNMEEEDAMKLLEKCRLNYRHKWLGHMVTSLWSAVYNTQKKTMRLCAGMDYTHGYLFYAEHPGKIDYLN